MMKDILKLLTLCVLKTTMCGHDLNRDALPAWWGSVLLSTSSMLKMKFLILLTSCAQM